MATEDVGVQQSIGLVLSAQVDGRGWFRLRDFEFDGNVAGGLFAEGNLYAVNAVDGGVAGGSAAEDFNVGAGEEAEVSEVVADLLGELDGFEDSGLSDSHIAERHGGLLPDRYTTIAVVV